MPQSNEWRKFENSFKSLKFFISFAIQSAFNRLIVGFLQQILIMKDETVLTLNVHDSRSEVANKVVMQYTVLSISNTSYSATHTGREMLKKHLKAFKQLFLSSNSKN
jgi:hypothetical protein